MLVLSRKVGETLEIGDGIFLTVVSIHGNRVRLGIVAPRGVRIARQEVANTDRVTEIDPQQLQGHLDIEVA